MLQITLALLSLPWWHLGYLGEFQIFTQTLNSHQSSIKVKPLSSPTSMDFLDVTTFKGPDFDATGQLDTKVFFKPTDSHALLHYTSFHPKHTFRGIVKSQHIRYKRICSRPEDCIVATRTLFRALKNRGYPRSFLRTVRHFHKQPDPSMQREIRKKHCTFCCDLLPLGYQGHEKHQKKR